LNTVLYYRAGSLIWCAALSTGAEALSRQAIS
jgi:hypothetical protein